VRERKAPIGIAIAWLVIAAIVMLSVWPTVPQTGLGWVLFFIFSPPLYILSEVLFEYLWATKIGRSVSNHPSRIVRIAAGVVFGCVLLAISIWIQI